MLQLILSKNDQSWLQKRYSDLTITKENGIHIVFGDFRFIAIYGEIEISDTYEIRIEFKNSQVSDLPKVVETGSRIRKISEDRKIPLADLHSYDDGSACLCVKLAEPVYFPNGFSFRIFIEELVVPFFYAQSYFERHGSWPWGTYSHGILGWIEWYFDQEDITKEDTDVFLGMLEATQYWQIISGELTKSYGIKGHHSCMCGSLKKYRNCHSNVFRGLRKLRADIEKFEIPIEFSLNNLCSTTLKTRCRKNRQDI
jgi:hypothetical protein